MIRVTHEYHYVKADSKLKHRWAIIMFKAASAYALGDIASYQKLYKTVQSEFSQWKAKAEIECKQKSKKNWLGGGETYIVSESDPTENGKRFFNIMQGRSRQEVMQTLMEMEQSNWIQLYTPV